MIFSIFLISYDVIAGKKSSFSENRVLWKRYIDDFHSISRDWWFFFEIPWIEWTILRFSTNSRTDQHQGTSAITHLAPDKNSVEIMYKIDLSQFCINKHIVNTWKYYSFDRKWFFHVLILYQFQARREMIKFWWY